MHARRIAAAVHDTHRCASVTSSRAIHKAFRCRCAHIMMRRVRAWRRRRRPSDKSSMLCALCNHAVGEQQLPAYFRMRCWVRAVVGRSVGRFTWWPSPPPPHESSVASTPPPSILVHAVRRSRTNHSHINRSELREVRSILGYAFCLYLICGGVAGVCACGVYAVIASPSTSPPPPASAHPRI